jgi:hypothetical protein
MLCQTYASGQCLCSVRKSGGVLRIVVTDHRCRDGDRARGLHLIPLRGRGDSRRPGTIAKCPLEGDARANCSRRPMQIGEEEAGGAEGAAGSQVSRAPSSMPVSERLSRRIGLWMQRTSRTPPYLGAVRGGRGIRRGQLSRLGLPLPLPVQAKKAFEAPAQSPGGNWAAESGRHLPHTMSRIGGSCTCPWHLCLFNELHGA